VEKFTVRILQKDIPRIVDIITAIPDDKVEQMRNNVHKVWQRWGKWRARVKLPN
jgi:hypothetical protein